jgi:hypothetical protein
MAMEITTGGKTLLESATFLALGLGETSVTLRSSDEEPLTFVFNFVEAKGEPENIRWVYVDAQNLRIELTNWNNPYGTTLTEPVSVGTLRHRRLYVMFFITKAGRLGEFREVTFATYLGEQVPDGAA